MLLLLPLLLLLQPATMTVNFFSLRFCSLSSSFPFYSSSSWFATSSRDVFFYRSSNSSSSTEERRDRVQKAEVIIQVVYRGGRGGLKGIF